MALAMSQESVSNRQTHGRAFFITLVTSGTAASVSKTAVAPIERVKLLLQLQDAQRTIAQQSRYRGIVDCIVRVYNEQGLASFWRGNAANVVRYFPTQALNFSLNDAYKKALLKKSEKVSFSTTFFGNLAAGGAAGATTLTLTYPLEFARTRLALDIGQKMESREFKGLRGCLSTIFKTDGITGLYRGYFVSVQCIFLYRAFYFGLFDAVKKVVCAKSDKKRLDLFSTFLIAQLVTVCSSYIVYPWDTVRRRMMMNSGLQNSLYKSSWDCTKKIVKFEGKNALYKGALSNVFRSTAGALVLTFYDEISRLV